MSTSDTDTTHYDQDGSYPHSLNGRTDKGGLGPGTEDTAHMAPSDRMASALGDPEKSVDGKSPSSGDVPPPTGPPAAGPDGGSRAWLVVFGAWCASFCTWGWINAVGVFQEYYQTTILSEYSSSTVSWITSLQIFFMMAMGLPLGVLLDRYGPRWLLLGGSFLHVFGLMMASISTEYYQILLSQGVCSAIGISAIFYPTLAVIPGWFTSKRGTAYGVLATGSSIGGITLPIMVNRLIPMIGFGWAMRTVAFVFLAFLVVSNLTVAPFAKPQPRKPTLGMFWRPFGEIQFVTLSVGMAIFTWGLYVPMNYLQVEASAHGMRESLVQYLVAMFGAGSLFGRLLAGVFGDKLGLFNVFIVVCFISALWILALWIPAYNDACRIAFAVLYGFFTGAYVSQLPALIAMVSPIREIGVRLGLVFICASIPALTSNPIAGAILGDNNNWAGAKAFAGVFCIVGTCFVVVTRWSKSKDWRAKI